jgi:hypothetical protein
MLCGGGRDQCVAQFDAMAFVIFAKVYTGSLSRLGIDRDTAQSTEKFRNRRVLCRPRALQNLTDRHGTAQHTVRGLRMARPLL